MPTPDEHNALIARITAWARKRMTTAGQIGFMIFTLDEAGRLDIAEADPACFASDGGRDRLADRMRVRFRKAGIVRYATAAEAWVTRSLASALPLRDALAAAQAMGAKPEPREEVVVIHVCDRQAASLHVLGILRDPVTGRVTDLATLDDGDGNKPIGGRFVNLLDGMVH